MASNNPSGATTGGCQHLHSILDSLGILNSDEVHETASDICQSARDTTISHGTDDIVLESAALALACRIEEQPWGVKDIATVVPASKQDIRQISWKMNSSLEIKVPPHDAALYIDRYCDELDVSPETRDIAHDIYESCPPHFNSGTPTGIAASAIYGAATRCDEVLTQNDVAENADVSEVTIRNWYSEQLTHYDNADT